MSQQENDHHHLTGQAVVVALTNGTTTITGTLLAEHGAEGEHIIDIGGGAEIRVHPEQVRSIREPEPTPKAADERSHVLADHQSRVSDAHWAESKAIHEAAHAVIGMMGGMVVEAAWVTADRTEHVGGEVRFDGGGDAQAVAVHLIAGPMAHAKALAELGYDDLTQAGVELLAGQGDHGKIDAHQRDGFVIWRSQAHRDAQALLDSRKVWKAIRVVGRALLGGERLSDAGIRALIGEPRNLTKHRMWVPDL